MNNISRDLLIGIVIGIFIMFLVSNLINNCFGLSNGKNILNQIIKTLLRQSSRWSEAAKQDNNNMIEVLHANYGAGYLWALNDIATSKQIEDATGINYIQYRDEIIRIQDSAVKKMAKLCPQFAPPPSVLTKLSGEGV